MKNEIYVISTNSNRKALWLRLDTITAFEQGTLDTIVYTSDKRSFRVSESIDDFTEKMINAYEQSRREDQS